MQIEIGFAFFYLPNNVAQWLTTPSCNWVIALLEKENVPIPVNMLFMPTGEKGNHQNYPNDFDGKLPNDIENKIKPEEHFPREYSPESRQDAKQITNSQIQLQWAKEEVPRFALEAANGRDVWSYQPNPKCIMPYERWMMRLINYCLHYDAEDFYQRYI